MQLSKLTTRYIAAEDRFLVSAESDQGNINLWLTQRLLLNLLPHLLNWLNENSPQLPEQIPAAAADSQVGLEGSRQQDSVQPQVASQLISQTRRATTRVDANKATRAVLVQTIHFRPRGKRIYLAFQLSDDEEAILPLQAEHLRIWLATFYNGWQKACWPNIWPEWMKQAHEIRRQYPAQTMH